MEEFFQYELPKQIFWVEEEALPAKQSAFVRYTDSTGGFQGKSCSLRSNYGNVNKRMMEFLRRSWVPMTTEGKESERERCFRHMLSERMRRDKQKQSYSALHSLLPPATKKDKNSIIQTAAKEVQELQKYRNELERRNREIEAILAAREGGKIEAAKIRLRVANPSSGIDSMVEVLKCLKSMGSTTRAIQSYISAQELAAVLEIESGIDATEVEKAVQRSLFEVERKLRDDFPI